MKGLGLMITDLKIVLYVYKLAHRLCKSYLPLVISSSFVTAVQPLINMMMLKLVIDELTGAQRIPYFIGLVGIAMSANFILNVLQNILKTWVAIKDNDLMNGFDLMIGEKVMSLDFEMVEDPEILDLKERALFPVHNQGVFQSVIEQAMTLVSQVITMIGLIAILTTLNPLLIIFLFVMAVITTLINKKTQKVMYDFYQLLIPVNRKFGYYAKVTTDFSYGKDIRLYEMDKLLIDRIEQYNETSLSVFTKLYVVLGRYLGYNELVLQLQMVLVYVYMAYKVVTKSIGFGDFTMYASAATQFGQCLSIVGSTYMEMSQMCRYLEPYYKVVTKSIGFGDFTMYASAATQFGQCLSIVGSTYMEMSQMCRYLEPYLEFDALKSTRSNGKGTLDSSLTPTIEFRGVSFKYPKSDAYALKDVNITIKAGEKLSIVGLNGAGKTTFIKLLTRLYEPTEGGIYLNGINILEYDLKSYLELMSVVFQDFKLLAFSVKENIVFDEEVDDDSVISILKEAGFEQDLNKLPKGIHTPIYKTFEEDGIEFSGGQSQKIAIARAIYKDSPLVILDEPTSALDPIAEYEIYRRFNELVGEKTTSQKIAIARAIYKDSPLVILDEPTSALDPIAEYEIYRRFNELVGEKTTIYISHRLSSCLFCDQIAVFKDGRMVEYGTHQDLIHQNDGLYQEMYQAQAQYYV